MTWHCGKSSSAHFAAHCTGRRQLFPVVKWPSSVWKLTPGHYSAKEGNFPRVIVRCFIICRVLLINSLTLSALKSLFKFSQSSVSVGMLLIFYLKVEKETVNSGVTYRQAGLPVPVVDFDKSSGWEGIST